MKRFSFTLLSILFLSPMSLLAKSGSSEAGLFYSTSWGSGVMGGYNYTNEILLGGDFAAGDSSSTSGDNLTMQDLSYSGSNTRSISSTAVDNLTLTY